MLSLSPVWQALSIVFKERVGLRLGCVADRGLHGTRMDRRAKEGCLGQAHQHLSSSRQAAQPVCA